jgi:hypothetical protein
VKTVAMALVAADVEVIIAKVIAKAHVKVLARANVVVVLVVKVLALGHVNTAVQVKNNSNY